MLAYPDSRRGRVSCWGLLRSGEDLDVLELDIVWPGVLAPHLLDLGLGLAGPERARPFPVGIDELQRRRPPGCGGPWYAERRPAALPHRSARPLRRRRAGELGGAGRLRRARSRKASVPRAMPDFWGFLWQGRAGEGLTVNALEWITSAGAPGILAHGRQRPGRRSAQRGRPWRRPPRGSTRSRRAQVLDMGGGRKPRRVHRRQCRLPALLVERRCRWPMRRGQSRCAADVAMTELPAGDGPDGRHAAVLGGVGLAVSQYSRQPDLAMDLVRWLTSAEEQKRRALGRRVRSQPPALYQDPELVAQAAVLSGTPACHGDGGDPAGHDRQGCVRCGQPGLRGHGTQGPGPRGRACGRLEPAQCRAAPPRPGPALGQLSDAAPGTAGPDRLGECRPGGTARPAGAAHWARDQRAAVRLCRRYR